jgi:MOSC domain-containing protein YiiM
VALCDQTSRHGPDGENLTTHGIDLMDAFVGKRWAVGTAVLEVSQPRVPCYKPGIRMGDPVSEPGSPRLADPLRTSALWTTGTLARATR